MKNITLDASSIDDFFIYKHKVEDAIADKDGKPVNRMTIDSFINDYIDVTKNSFYCHDTKNVIAFSIKEIDNEQICFRTPSDERTNKAFDNVMEQYHWDINDILDNAAVGNSTDNDYIVIGTEMRSL